jgi:GGDEF domain-containing protein
MATSGADSIHGFKLSASKAVIMLSLVELASYLYAINTNYSFKPILSALIIVTDSVLMLTITSLLRLNTLLMRSLKENPLMHTRNDIKSSQDCNEAVAACTAGHVNSANTAAYAGNHAEENSETVYYEGHADVGKSNPAANSPNVPGLHSKHELNLKLDEEMVRANRQRVPLFFAIISIDNDEMPDNTFAIVGHDITNNIRAKIDTGFICTDREFAIILPFTVKKHAVNIVKRILISLNTWDIDASIGLVSCNGIGTNDATEVIKVAELAAGEARAEGGNRIRLLRKNSDRQTEYIPPRARRSKHLKLLK